VVAALRGARAALPPRTWLPRRTAITLEIGPVFRLHAKDPASVSEVQDAAHGAMVALTGEPDACGRTLPQ
jgi:1-acyl-sn-glycerol-3-phosphate acyltransferase